jgi:hypothetical protein
MIRIPIGNRRSMRVSSLGGSGCDPYLVMLSIFRVDWKLTAKIENLRQADTCRTSIYAAVRISAMRIGSDLMGKDVRAATPI